MILLPGIVFLAFPAAYFISEHHNATIIVLALLLMTGSSVFLYLTATMNPGFIPRQELPFAKGPIGAPVLSAYPSTDRKYFELQSRGKVVRLKYCSTCMHYAGYVFRPPRCSHCSDCDACVERFDHHCPWVGNCIGKRNYRYFYCFLVFTAAFTIFTFSVTAAHIYDKAKEASDAGGHDDGFDAFLSGLQKAIPSVVLNVYAFVVSCRQMFWFIGGLTYFHTYLCLTNQTTYERLKGIWKGKAGNPFAYNASYRNFFSVLCSRLAPQHFDLRSIAILDIGKIALSHKLEAINPIHLGEENYHRLYQVSGLKPRGEIEMKNPNEAVVSLSEIQSMHVSGETSGVGGGSRRDSARRCPILTVTLIVMFCCTTKATYPVVRLRRRPRLTANTQLVLSKANRLWDSSKARAFARWRHSKDMRKLTLLTGAEEVKLALQSLLRRVLFDKLHSDLVKRSMFRRVVREMQRLAVGKVSAYFAQWVRKCAKAAELDHLAKRRIKTVVVYLRQQRTISLRSWLHLWRRHTMKDDSMRAQAQQLSAVKLRVTLVSVLRRLMLCPLRAKVSIDWAFRQLEKFTFRFATARLGLSLALWKREVDTAKGQHIVQQSLSVGAIIAAMKQWARERRREAIAQWKELLPAYRTLTVNGVKIRGRKEVVGDKAWWPDEKSTVFTESVAVFYPARPPTTFCARCYVGTRLSPFDHMQASYKLENNLKLLRRTFLTLSRATNHKALLHFEKWATVTAATRHHDTELAHTTRALVSLLDTQKRDRLSTALCLMKVPRKVQRFHSAVRMLLRSYCFSLQKSFYRWSGSAKSVATMHQIAAVKLASMAKRIMKKVFFLPIIDNTAKRESLRHYFLSLNRIFLKGVSRQIQKWSKKTIETGLLNLQDSLKRRRLKVIMLTWMGKDKAFYFQKLKGLTSSRSLKEKYLGKMLRLTNKQRLKSVMSNFRTAAKQRTKKLNALKAIRKVAHRRLLFPLAQLKSIPRQFNRRSDSSTDSYLLRTLRNSIDSSPLPKPSFFQSLFRS